jgi:hypothetical protein
MELFVPAVLHGAAKRTVTVNKLARSNPVSLVTVTTLYICVLFHGVIDNGGFADGWRYPSSPSAGKDAVGQLTHGLTGLPGAQIILL